jgi:hypothetical protein
VARGEYVEVVPNVRVVFTWGWEDETNPVVPGSTTVEVTLEPDGRNTVVRLRHLALVALELHVHVQEHAAVGLAGDPAATGLQPWKLMFEAEARGVTARLSDRRHPVCLCLRRLLTIKALRTRRTTRGRCEPKRCSGRGITRAPLMASTPLP